MATIFDLKILFTVVKQVKQGFSKRKVNANEALGAVRKAFNHTYDYIYNNNGENKSNIDLADLWNEASTKVSLVDPELGRLLANKSRFWTHPDIYERLNRLSEVPNLKDITDEMERLQKILE